MEITPVYVVFQVDWEYHIVFNKNANFSNRNWWSIRLAHKFWEFFSGLTITLFFNNIIVIVLCVFLVFFHLAMLWMKFYFRSDMFWRIKKTLFSSMTTVARIWHSRLSKKSNSKVGKFFRIHRGHQTSHHPITFGSHLFVITCAIDTTKTSTSWTPI